MTNRPPPMAKMSCGCNLRDLLPVNMPTTFSRADNLSYIEHIFEISRRPDLLTRVIEYRTTVLKISEDDEIDTKLTRIPSAKKYKGKTASRRADLRLEFPIRQHKTHTGDPLNPASPPHPLQRGSRRVQTSLKSGAGNP